MADLKTRIAKRCAKEFKDGDFVNLGIGEQKNSTPSIFFSSSLFSLFFLFKFSYFLLCHKFYFERRWKNTRI